ncbi:hypothetical protein MNB_SV-3-988 [hydrothermal vent metagenome]|uniref:Uncharacterized protein n=1 Tax=hydrothermal vent metagenome TaxID=652676 RepID=A0A1W1BXF8_9ZZZZ
MITITIDNTKATQEEVAELAKILQLGEKVLFSKEGRAKARSMEIAVEVRNQSAKEFKALLKIVSLLKKIRNLLNMQKYV